MTEYLSHASSLWVPFHASQIMVFLYSRHTVGGIQFLSCLFVHLFVLRAIQFYVNIFKLNLSFHYVVALVRGIGEPLHTCSSFHIIGQNPYPVHTKWDNTDPSVWMCSLI